MKKLIALSVVIALIAAFAVPTSAAVVVKNEVALAAEPAAMPEEAVAVEIAPQNTGIALPAEESVEISSTNVGFIGQDGATTVGVSNSAILVDKYTTQYTEGAMVTTSGAVVVIIHS